MSSSDPERIAIPAAPAPSSATTGSGRVGGRSLFWTVLSVLLGAAILGTTVQWLVADAVLRPLEARDARSRSELSAARLATEMSAPDAPQGEVAIEALLAKHRAALELQRAWVAFRLPDGTIFSDPPGRGRQIEGILAPPGSTQAIREPQVRFDVLGRHAAERDGRQLGEVLIIRGTRIGPSGLFDSLATFLFVPIAFIGAGIAGLVIVRLLVRRLRAMEAVATRVSHGDLTARIRDPRVDEIGRVGAQLDAMIDRLSDARERIEENDLQRRQLFADITHELATPLTSIRWSADTLLNPQVPLTEDERQEYIRGIREEARRLDRLTKDLFELARLEAGATKISAETLDWAELCSNTIERFRPRFRDAGLRLEWRGPLEGAWVHADGHRLEQVLENLLANALRYVPTGGRVTIRLAAADAGTPSRWELTVEDDGPGIAAGDLPHLFERFYRATGAKAVRSNGNGNADGSGLGLAIVREIVERHGGRVAATARSPQGLAISVALPRGRQGS